MESFKQFLFLIIFNLFSYSVSIDNSFLNTGENDCLKLILYYNGKLKRMNETKNVTFEENILSIGALDKIILFDCLNKTDNLCTYRNSLNGSNSLEECQKRDSESNNYCCFINETHYDKSDNTSLINSGCIQVEKNEYKRFRINNSEIFYIYNSTGINSFGVLQCFDRIYSQRIYKFLFIFFVFCLF